MQVPDHQENKPFPRKAPGHYHKSTGKIKHPPRRKDFEITQADPATLELLAQEAMENHSYDLAENYFLKAWEKDKTRGIQGLLDIARLYSLDDPARAMQLMDMADKLKKQSFPKT